MSLTEKNDSRLDQLLKGFGEFKKKNYFGGYCLIVDNVIVGLALDGLLYLRGCLFARSYFESIELERLVFSKKGIPLELRYYQLPQQIWENEALLLHCIDLAYRSAIEERQQKQSAVTRIKDLPNMNMSVERALGKIGIHKADDLREIGAKACFLKLKQLGRFSPSIKLLIGLAGAIEGYHSAVLPTQIKQELINWYNSVGWTVLG
ncbi:TfoX/Sxy family DNA transformation protein [Providencia stuartii]|nr:TfoX/Sxy family DNA transformation protein [Providencia stuartii]MDK7735489.1 TfoX/Sxy family DNA transformation protein [Providencia stuartii]MDN0005315.1 TfoX/Sxy family DNA transformation protein [Providencia stuartii]MDN0010580.1 TfoX/Sxy family DNA transformation protein [Providencia stuartii]MDN0018817.1 TfoX/Sxy family DNA transformation protein [Providencia stuartii]MDN7222937.1 TfoX/Sxy family DNA transformation protein [Providencia stuartii]